MSIRMLIDASHREETRVAIVDGNQLEDFDYESSAKKQLKGSIYLAKVTRVEPSLQAAFVDYGGNRHGFLAFSEIHPDYYQIPVADREALIAAEAEANADLLEDDAEEEKPKKRRRRRTRKKAASEEVTETEAETSDEDAKSEDKKEEKAEAKNQKSDDEPEAEEKEEKTEEEEKPKKKRGRPKKSTTKAEATKDSDVIEEDIEADAEEEAPDAGDASDDNDNDDIEEETEEEASEKETEDDDAEEADPKEAARSEEEEEERLRIRAAKRLRYKYKIQEVIKKNQIILIQVVKEERGNKGAALTTYLSLPGRYCVLMPNTLHGGGVSRKIANIKDRKKLKNVLASLNMPRGHACIIRTAGSDRTKAEIKRDYDYLRRMWEAIRELTLKSIAPAQIYEEGNLIKRSIRDLYTRDVGEIIVDGESGYKTAKEFMGMLMPSHAKKVKNYKDEIPLFQRYQVENSLDEIYSPTAQLKSGGYIVINPTEALVAIDVNSGRATKEHNIEETALKTNLEAAEEVARQLKLRDMAGLVVIDFIDMEEPRNNRAVERKMKACLKNDRARIQVGRISSFGLMEMSRQRLRVGVLESSTNICPHCDGSGLLRSVESQSLHILRIIEEEGIKARNSKFVVYLPSKVAVYILNNKRHKLLDLEQRYDFSVAIAIDDELTASAYRMERSGKPSRNAKKKKESLRLGRDVNKLIDVTEEDVSPEEETKDRPRRRRRRRGGRNRNRNAKAERNENSEIQADENADATDDNQEKGRRKRRPRRGRKAAHDNNQEAAEQVESPAEEVEAKAAEEEKPKARRGRRKKSEDADNAPDEKVAEEAKAEEEKPKKAPRKRAAAKKTKPKTEEKTEAEPKGDEAEEKPKKAPRKRAAAKKAKPKAEEKVAEENTTAEEPKETKPKKKGWWSR